MGLDLTVYYKNLRLGLSATFLESFPGLYRHPLTPIPVKELHMEKASKLTYKNHTSLHEWRVWTMERLEPHRTKSNAFTPTKVSANIYTAMHPLHWTGTIFYMDVKCSNSPIIFHHFGWYYGLGVEGRLNILKSVLHQCENHSPPPPQPTTQNKKRTMNNVACRWQEPHYMIMAYQWYKELWNLELLP